MHCVSGTADDNVGNKNPPKGSCPNLKLESQASNILNLLGLDGSVKPAWSAEVIAVFAIGSRVTNFNIA
jgi:hypothetical protein